MPATLRPRPTPGLGAALIGAEEEALVLDVLRRKEPFRYYGADFKPTPPMVAQLEKEFREFIVTEYALAVSSGTGALEVALGAMGIGPGDEVIVTAWSWISCFTAIVRMGARPVLAEIDDSLNLNPDEIKRLATPRTRAVLVVHYQGVAADMERIVLEAHRRGIFVLEDCAQSLGTRYRGRQIGTWGDVATFSFQNNKVATGGEGGMVTTRDQRIYERAVRLSDLGNYRPYHAAIVPPHEPAFVGGQYRMSELTGALVLAQLRKVAGMWEHCRSLQARILPRLAGLKGLRPRRIPDAAGDFGFEIYLFMNNADHVNPFREKLEARNVPCGARTGTYPQYNREYVKTGLAHHPAASPFRELKPWPAAGYRAEDFPITEDLTKRFLALPLGALYTAEDAEYIADALVAVHAEVCG
ncbi:MAG: DegT/DnrJ/EryC1/StrS family aminotransferase [Opitutaceae bacterium]|nr:DegT/DnrJ/EryC1/StrS family aminotransferase [Opitutaceae bacterium]MBP9913327.1 DegT/DnrJ/EryC1/StrS family aminotransferase [Opitutaceae bacterium]